MDTQPNVDWLTHFPLWEGVTLLALLIGIMALQWRGRSMLDIAADTWASRGRNARIAAARKTVRDYRYFRRGSCNLERLRYNERRFGELYASLRATTIVLVVILTSTMASELLFSAHQYQVTANEFIDLRFRYAEQKIQMLALLQDASEEDRVELLDLILEEPEQIKTPPADFSPTDQAIKFLTGFGITDAFFLAVIACILMQGYYSLRQEVARRATSEAIDIVRARRRAVNLVTHHLLRAGFPQNHVAAVVGRIDRGNPVNSCK